MALLNAINDYLSSELRIGAFEDSSLNGLQVEGRGEIRRVALAVDCGRSVIEEAVSRKADLLFVHHGLIWEKPFRLSGAVGETFQTIFQNGLSVYAAHIPLDAHERLGNNFTLARLLSLEGLRPAVPHRNALIACVGDNTAALSLTEMAQRVRSLPGGEQTSLVLPFGPAIPKRVCVLTGSGADALHRAAADGFDTLVSGEPKQFAYHFARDNSLNVIFGGHYATETVGVLEVGKELVSRFGVETEFIDQPTGI